MGQPRPDSERERYETAVRYAEALARTARHRLTREDFLAAARQATKDGQLSMHRMLVNLAAFQTLRDRYCQLE